MKLCDCISYFYSKGPLSPLATSLWLKLFHLSCSGRQKTLTMDLQGMLTATGFSRAASLQKAREELVGAGLLKVSKAAKGKPMEYTLDFGELTEPVPEQKEPEPVPESKPEADPVLFVEAVPMEPEKKPNRKSKHANKLTFGEYGRVHLTQKQYDELRELFPDTWEMWIEKCDSYSEQEGKTYANPLAAIKNWAKKDRVNDKQGRHQAATEISKMIFANAQAFNGQNQEGLF